MAARDAAQPPSPSPLPLLSLHALPCFPTGNWTITTSAALKMEPSERCAIWRSCELILRLLPCVCERECVHCAERKGGACVQGGSLWVLFWVFCCNAIKIGHREIPPAYLGQSVCRLQSVISHLPQTGVPQSSRFSHAPAVFVGADGQNSPPASVCVFRERLSECGHTRRQVTGLWPVTEGLSPEGELELARSREGP